jgi:hypothetical protein
MDTAKTPLADPPAPAPPRALPPLPATPLLIDEEPLLVPPRLAAAIGLNEAIVLQQVRYWLGDKRRPQVRDGRRWVYNTYPQWQAQFPFWSLATIKKTFRDLEERGLLLAAQRYNRAPTDRTKWYTIDFARLLALDAALGIASEDVPRAQFHPLEGGDPDIGRDQDDPLGRAQIDPLEGRDLTPSNQRLPAEISTEIPQQQTTPPSASAHAAQPAAVVVASPRLVQLLTERGITAGVARRLVADHPLAMVARQVAHFDHECAADPADPRLTPGRLRRRIEGDWTPPPGFVSTDERVRRATEGERQRAEARAAGIAEDERCRRGRAATLAAVGATAEDQATWHSLATSPTPLPTIFRTALFRAPGTQTPPVIILRTAEEHDRAVGDGYVRERRELERRLRERFPTYARASLTEGVRAHYVAYDDCAEQLADAARGDAVAAVRSATPEHTAAARGRPGIGATMPGQITRPVPTPPRQKSH